jgi:hypothetical protein
VLTVLLMAIGFVIMSSPSSMVMRGAEHA